MSRAMVQAALPDASARDQALAVLPFSIQDLEGFDSLAATFAAGDMATLAPQSRSARCSDAGAAELVSSIAFLMGQQIPADGRPRQDVQHGLPSRAALTARRARLGPSNG